MKESKVIGVVYDLREEYLEQGFSYEETAEFDTRESIRKLSESMRRLGFEVDLVGSGLALARRLAKGERWDLVFPMAEGISGKCREARVPALLDLYGQPYALSDASTMAATLDKATAKIIVSHYGVPTAPFRVIDGSTEWTDDWDIYPAFVKPLAEGTSKGCNLESIVHDSKSAAVVASKLIEQFNQPAIVESYLPGDEFTVGVVGNGETASSIGVAKIVMGPDADQIVFTRRNKEDQWSLCSFQKAREDVAKNIEIHAVAAYRALGCRDCCRIDFRCDIHGNPSFLEANPIPGLHPENSDLPVLAQACGVKYDDLVARIISEALSRNGIA